MICKSSTKEIFANPDISFNPTMTKESVVTSPVRVDKKSTLSTILVEISIFSMLVKLGPLKSVNGFPETKKVSIAPVKAFKSLILVKASLPRIVSTSFTVVRLFKPAKSVIPSLKVMVREPPINSRFSNPCKLVN